MCGRFTLTATASELQVAFPWLRVPGRSGWAARYNIAPGQTVAVVTNNGQQTLEYFRWGLVPPWVKDRGTEKMVINARAETLGEKPLFRTAYRSRRCLVLADGFYEWQRRAGCSTKTPVYIQLRSGKPFAFAGLWDTMASYDGSRLSACVVVTTAPNVLLEPIHSRMPVILPDAAIEPWLDPAKRPPHALDTWLQTFPSEPMMAHRVSTLVNNPLNDSPACVAPP